MIKITVTNTPIREMKGIGKTSGKPYHMRIQTVYAHTVSLDGVFADFPDKTEIALEDGQTPYPAGVYTLQPSSVYVSRDGRLEMRPRLVAVPVRNT
jgi:hypothetical protein